MRLSSSLPFLICLLSAVEAFTHLVIPQLFRRTASPVPPIQNPLMNLPIAGFRGRDKGSADTGDVMLSDVIGKDRAINIFAGFTRDIEPISKRLDDDTKNSTLLAPLNSQIQKLPRKPWEDPKDYSALGQSAYDGSAGEDRAQRNLRRFVEAHVVPVSPWKEGEKVRSIGGGEIWWEEKEGVRTVCAPAACKRVLSRIQIDKVTGATWKYRGIKCCQSGFKR